MLKFYVSTISSSTVSWLYLTNWVLALVLGVAFIFYFARLVGFILTLLLRLLVWKRYRLRVFIGALRVSPLGGRVSARNVVLSNADYTVSILCINFTWRYWLLRLARFPAYHFSSVDSGLNLDQNAKLPTRFQVHIDGLEIFCYNRTVAYENIIETLKKSAGPDSCKTFQTESTDSSLAAPAAVLSALSHLLLVLPVHATIKRGAFVFGNHLVPSILVASFKTANAVVDVEQAPSELDLFRFLLELDMEKFQVSLKPNITFDPQKYAAGHDFAQPHEVKLSESKTTQFRRKVGIKLRKTRAFSTHKASGLLLRLNPKNLRWNKKTVPENVEWHGLRRYVGNFDRDRVVDLSHIDEYAKYSVILESEATRLVYYFDSPGVESAKSDFHGGPDDNPEFGVDLILSMATIHYGSWADRQRAPLQAILFPVLARDSSPTPAAVPRVSLRRYAGFNLRVKTNDEIILRVPTREFSKDKEDISLNRDKKSTRPFGWLEMKMSRGSEVHSFTSYIATSDGWPNKFDAKMNKLEIRTSVTHNILYTADEHTIHGSIGFPLKWNGQCNWDFGMVSEKGQFFFLREHVDLFSDLMADFASGPLASYENYRPFEYKITWNILDFRFFLNVNDHNIINDPLDFESNKYLCFSGQRLDISLVIPLKGDFSTKSTIDYRIYTPHLDLTLEVPPWHTVSAFMRGSKKMGSTDSFEVSGYYNFYSQIQVDHHNFAVINAIGDNITLLFYGYFIRYLFTLRENYFGDFTKFTTFEEYAQRQTSEKRDDVSEKPDADYWNILKTENDLNVLFTFSARNGMIVLPCQIFDYSRHISLNFDYLDVDIHLTNFYMDMQVNFSTGYGYQMQSLADCELVFDVDRYQNEVVSSPEIIIDNFSVHAHRMLGIDDLTYQCKWDFACESIVLDSEPLLLNGLSLALSNFAMGFKDLENTLLYEVPTIYDAAHFSFRCPKLKVRLFTGLPDVFLEAHVAELLVCFNDVANARYSSRISVLMPSVVVKIVEDSRIHAFLETSVTITDICQKHNMLEHRLLQQAHVRRNDAPTHRAPFYLFRETRDDVYDNALGSVFPSVSLPKASHPLTEEFYELHADNSLSSSNFSDSPASSFSSTSGSRDFANSDMNPTIDYYDPDFAPRKKPDPGWIYDCFVFEFDAVKAFLNPKALACFLNMVLDAQNFDFLCLVDRLHRETIQKLKDLILPRQMVDNFRAVCPIIDLKVCSESVESIDVVNSASPPFQVLSVSIVEPSVVLSLKQHCVPNKFVLEKSAETTIAVHVKDTFVSVSMPTHFSAALTLHLSGMEMWKTSYDGKEPSTSLVSSLLASVLVKVNLDLIDQMVNFMEFLAEGVRKALDNPKANSSASHRWRTQVIYELTKFGFERGLLHDPKVITNPANILRSSDVHVRIYDSWRVITKLRSMSQQGFACLDLRESGFTIPEDAFSYIVQVFSRWRTWEGNLLQREQYFNEMIGAENSIGEAGTAANCIVDVDLKSLEMGFLGEYQDGDYVAVQNIQAQLKNGEDFVVNIDGVDISTSQNFFEVVQYLRKRNAKKEEGEEKERREEKEIEENEGSKEIEEPKTKGQKSPLNLSVLFNLKQFHSRIQLPETFVELHSFENTASCEYSQDSSKVLLVAKSRESGFLFGKEVENGNGVARGFLLVFAGLANNGGDVAHLAGALDVTLQDLDIKLLDRTHTLIPAIRGLMNDITAVVASSEPPSTDAKSGPSTKASFDFSQLILPTVSVNLEMDRASLYIELLEPLRFFSSISKSVLHIQSSADEMLWKYSYAKIKSDLAIIDTSLLRTESSRFSVSAQTSVVGSRLLVRTTVYSDYFKATTPLVLSAADMALTMEAAIRARVHDIQEMIQARGNDTRGLSNEVTEEQVIGEPPIGIPQTKSTGSSILDHIVFRGTVQQEYCGWSTYRGQSRFSVEAEGIDLLVLNVGESGRKTALFGHFNVPATRVSIVDQLLSTRLSTVVDFNLCTKVVNDTGEQHEMALVLRSLQIESEYFRACFSPSVVFKVYDFVESFQTLTSKHVDKRATDVAGIETPSGNNGESHQQEPQRAESPGQGLGFHSVHVLLHNFCVGWLFDTAYKDYPGFILGAERIFAVTKANLGKLTVMDGYMSVANGSTASSFYSQSSEVHNLNRAFMPKMQLNYYISSDGKLWASLLGDTLDVRFMSNSTIAIERGIHSVSQVMAHFDKRSQELRKRHGLLRRRIEKNLEVKGKAEKEEVEKSDDKMKMKNGAEKNEMKNGAEKNEMKNEAVKTKDEHHKQEALEPRKEEDKKSVSTPSFSAVQFSIMFAGSKVYICQLQEGNTYDQPPSLTLHAPAVQIVIGYDYKKSHVKKHSIKTEILVTQSDNTVYSSCVPVLRDFVEASKTMVQTEPHDEKARDSGKSDLSMIFREIDFHMGLVMHKQRICLSCEPTAKVAAVVEFDGASAQVCSGIEAFEAVYILAKMSSISVSLQHAYSDERSGNFGIKSLIVSSMVAFRPHVELSTSWGISDIVGSVKMKQYQDVELFRDIWSLKSREGAESEYSTKSARSARERSRAKEIEKARRDEQNGKKQRLKENDQDHQEQASTFSVSLEIIMSKTSLEVDFGASLGVMALKLDTAWAMSRRGSNWFYEMSLGLQKLSVRSEGRLGGTLQVDGVHLKSAVDWKLEEVLQVPLIHMSGGFGEFRTKVVFDEHVFALCRMKQWNFEVYNRKNGHNVSKDHLFVMIHYKSFELFLTSLAAAEFYDIYTTISRMVEAKRTSYTEILKDSNPGATADLAGDPLDVVKKLETNIEVVTGITLLQVYPYSFSDNNVLVVELDQSKVQFTQSEYTGGIFNQIELQLNNVRASFSATAGISLAEVNDGDVHELILYAEGAKGGQMLGLPKFMISMHTYQQYHSNRVEHLFQSTFGGTVDIRWNLGAVNAVREMYAAHKRALLAKIEMGKRKDVGVGALPAKNLLGLMEPVEPGVHKEIDRDIQDTLEKVNTSKFVYSALVPPIIEAPQLKELGTATPPLEWFGLHRNKFPDATHQLVIVTLQKVLSEIEHEYSKILGRA